MARTVLLSIAITALWLLAVESTVIPIQPHVLCYPTPPSVTTTNKCAVTKKVPVPTTKAPVPTTKATVPTTKATVPTTKATVPTTKATVCTTKATVPTTKATVATTKATVATTKATVATTKTTKATVATTKATVCTTKATPSTTKATVAPTKPQCGMNEVYSECGNNGCQNTCRNPTFAMVCRGICTPGCICKEGYLRNSKNQCVLPDNCDCAGPYEVWSKCDNHGCQNTCEDPNLITKCTYLPGCYPGCICQKGYLRNKDGICVPQSKCYQCKANEVFKDCGCFECESTCKEKDLVTRCTPLNPCEPGCFCAAGFVRDENRNCVLPKDCPNVCSGVHEVYSECGNDSCQKNCDTYDLTLACKPSCTPGCICENGYIRNKNGVCVLPEQCENRICNGKNEIYSICVSPCGERCSNLGQDIVCNFLVCNPGCDCKPGFFRNSKNECVPPEQCDCAPNEELDLCHNPCPPRTCDAIGKIFTCATPIVCKPACKCIFNHRRNSDGVCVPVEKCPALTCTRENEEYNPCPPSCLDQRCKSLYDPIMCAAVVTECSPRCVCKPGHLISDEGKCIPQTQCREYCSDPNAIFDPCGNVCPLTCANKDKPRICPDVCLASGGCVCKSGFAQDYKGKCIPIAECPSCGPNEVFACGSACDTTCATLGDVCPIVNIKCNEMCYCIDGYARNAQNVCVPIKECPPKFTCGKNQVYNPCPPSCPPEETCESYLSGMVVACAFEERVQCKPRCECASGFVKNAAGECITPNQCCPDPNQEIVSCPNPCPGGTCESPMFALCDAACKIRGCQCKPGYVKNNLGKCILLSQCPKPCGENEEWNSCGDGTIAGCVPGCQCKTGFTRINGKCIIKPADPTCGAYEQYATCAPNIQQTCATLSTPACFVGCKPGCVCIPGYVRECKGGKCIKTCDCKPYY